MDDDLALPDLGLEDPPSPLPRRQRFNVDTSDDAVDQRKLARAEAQGAGRRADRDGAPDAAEEPPIHFKQVQFDCIAYSEPEPPSYWWAPYLPAGVVTLLGAHGGTGKSTLALMLAVSIALGLSLFGIPTKRGRVVYFSGEDGAELLLFRLHWICKKLDIDVVDLHGWLTLLDATDNDPALFHEISTSGKRHGCTTPSYAALHALIEERDADVLIVDNASDTFDASEIDRARVRGFMRALAALAKPDRAVLLLAHVDKGTSRGERAQTSEGYSGSTAWHNSARSRLYLSRQKDGGLLLEQQKHNLGKAAEPLALTWPHDGLPQAEPPMAGIVQHIADNVDTKALLKLVHEFYGRGEFIATGPQSRNNATKVLGEEPSYPKRRKTAEVFQMLREAERRKWIARETYRDRNRKEHERWALTATGCSLIGAAAPSAPCAPSAPNSNDGDMAQQGAPSAPCGVQGVRGNGARATGAAWEG